MERKEFLDDLVREGYCHREEIKEVLEDLEFRKINVLRVGEKYGLILRGGEYYLIEEDLHVFNPGGTEPIIRKVIDISGEGNLELGEIEKDSKLVGDLQRVVADYYKNRKIDILY